MIICKNITVSNFTVSTVSNSTSNSSSSPSWSPGDPPEIVQFAYENTGNAYVSLGATPNVGNLLVAIIANPDSNFTASGWNRLANDASGIDYIDVLTKVVPSGDTATQYPVTVAYGGAIMIWELAHTDVNNPVANVSVTGQLTTANSQTTAYAQGPHMLTLAGAFAQNTASISQGYGVVVDVNNVGTRTIYGGHSTNATTSVSQLTVACTGTVELKMGIIQLMANAT